jgi:hypothetical protein
MKYEDVVLLARRFARSTNDFEKRRIQMEVEKASPQNKETFAEWVWLYQVLNGEADASSTPSSGA